MILLNPNNHNRPYKDEKSKVLMQKTIDFFENKGLKKLKKDWHDKTWNYDFVEFMKEAQAFATLMTPAGYGAEDSRWDTYRNNEFSEITAFYGITYWYTWQVSMLGLGPIWLGGNEEVKQKTAQLLQDGSVFVFGLSEKEHGADIYSSDMMLYPQEDGTYKANGDKYYIGNGNEAALVSTFAKMADTGEYVFFVVDSKHEKYECVRNVVHEQNYVAEFALHRLSRSTPAENICFPQGPSSSSPETWGMTMTPPSPILMIQPWTDGFPSCNCAPQPMNG